jgi:hypothetical protein
MTFSKWEDAFTYAQSRANESGLSVGIEKRKEYGKEVFSVRYLPKAENRYGENLRCEVVNPSILK